MCLIIDANCATLTLSSNPSVEFAPVMQAILAKNAVMVLGGTKLRSEYQKLATVWRFIVALDRAGKTKAYPDTAIDALQVALEKSGMLKSDDPHILALAQISGARLLCSKDQDLHHDFLSKNLIDNPRGSIYQKKSHAPLLRKCCNR